MYNRYVPQTDGTYRRSRVSDPPPRQSQRPPQQSKPTPPPPEPEKPPCPPQKSPNQQSIHHPKQVDSFLKNLLPADFDTGDLIIILLLLLLAGDCQEDRNTALLTMMLYLFL